MTLMSVTEVRIAQALEKGFEDRGRYEEILNTMREVKNVGESNREYVKSLISVSETELRKMAETYGENCIREYQEQKSRLIKQLENSN